LLFRQARRFYIDLLLDITESIKAISPVLAAIRPLIAGDPLGF